MEKELKEAFKKIHTIAIYGDIGTGKTSLAYWILNNLKDKPIYFLRHPKPKLIEKLGYKNLHNIQLMETTENIILYLDEPQLLLSINDHKTNSIIARICSLARQRNITLIISSSDTRVFTKYNEAYFDIWLIKDVDFSMVKNGSKIKYAIKNYCQIDPTGFRLDKNEFLFHSRKFPELCDRKFTFSKPNCFTEEHSKPYKNSDKNSPKIPNKITSVKKVEEDE